LKDCWRHGVARGLKSIAQAGFTGEKVQEGIRTWTRFRDWLTDRAQAILWFSRNRSTGGGALERTRDSPQALKRDRF